MIRKRWLSLIIVLMLLVLVSGVASAQSYRFKVERANVDFYVNPDGTVSIEYVLDFSNEPGAHEIDYIDLGLPSSNYDRGSISAEVDGKTITDISSSGYQGSGTGVALGLGGNAIQPGQSGSVHIRVGKVDKMLHKADKPEKYGSVQFSPTWFGSEYALGNTDYTFTIYLPPGLETNEPIYFPPQNFPGPQEPESGYDDQGRVYYSWHSTEANFHTQYVFGAAFPERLVPEGVLITKPAFTINFDEIMEYVCPIACVMAFVLSPILMGVWGVIEGNRRKLRYLPPKISIEGHGIKRGLTPVQAGILMELPVDKILTMILFSVIKKGAAKVISRDPLKLEILNAPNDKLYPYEGQFLEAFQASSNTEQRKLLQKMMVDLVKSMSETMKGFSRKESVAYYKDIMNKAWNQVQAAGTPEMEMKNFEEAMDWTMLDRDFNDRSREIFRTRPVYVPMWWGHFDPTYHRPSAHMASPVSTGGGGGMQVSLPTLPGADFAASMVNSVQNFSSNVIGDLTSFTSGITNVTNPPPPPSRSSGSRRSGGGCACACACAGCACACAGGGR